jgi:hypothetical protein
MGHWIEAGNFPLSVFDDKALTAALRLLLPAYEGQAVRLYRGTAFREWRTRRFGFSWSADIGTAESFGRDLWQSSEGGGVVLETVAPAAAIIAKIVYPEPFTQAEREEILQECPNTNFNEFHGEDEYLIDRRYLGRVTVARRFEQKEEA